MTMSASLSEVRWRRLEALFLTAANMPAAHRDAFATREAAEDTELLLQLRGMLAHQADAPALLGGIVAYAVSGLETAARQSGRRFGAYRIVREIGRGGMGLVFE